MGAVFSCFKPSPVSSPQPNSTRTLETKVAPDDEVKFPEPGHVPSEQNGNSLQTPPNGGRPLSMTSGISGTDVLSGALGAAQFASQFAPVPGLGAGITVLQGIVAAFAQVQFNRSVALFYLHL